MAKKVDALEKQFKEVLANKKTDKETRKATAGAYADWLSNQEREEEAAKMRMKAGVSWVYYGVIDRKSKDVLLRYKSLSRVTRWIEHHKGWIWRNWLKQTVLYTTKEQFDKFFDEILEVVLYEVPRTLNIVARFSQFGEKK